MHFSSEYEAYNSISPVIKGDSPNPVVTVNPGNKLITSKLNFLSLFEKVEIGTTTSRRPLESPDEVPTSVKVKCKTKEESFTPEISFSEKLPQRSPNVTDYTDISSDTGEDRLSNEVSSVEKKMVTQMTIDDITSQDIKPSLSKNLTQDKIPSHYKNLSQDKKPAKDQKPLREKKPPVSPVNESSQFNSRQDTLSQETSEETSVEMSLPLTGTSTPDFIPLQKSPLEMILLEKLPNTKHTNEEDSKDNSKEKSVDDKSDTSTSDSESESSAIPIEIELASEIDKSTENKLRLSPSANDVRIQEEMLSMFMDNTTYPTEGPSDSKPVDSQLALAPTLPKNIRKKGNRTDIDKSILTLLYLSENEKHNAIKGLDKFTKPPTDSESEEDVSVKAKTKNSTIRLRNVEAESVKVPRDRHKEEEDSVKVPANDEFSNSILFNILKQAVESGMFADKLKKMRSSK